MVMDGIVMDKLVLVKNHLKKVYQLNYQMKYFINMVILFQYHVDFTIHYF